MTWELIFTSLEDTLLASLSWLVLADEIPRLIFSADDCSFCVVMGTTSCSVWQCWGGSGSFTGSNGDLRLPGLTSTRCFLLKASTLLDVCSERWFPACGDSLTENDSSMQSISSDIIDSSSTWSISSSISFLFRLVWDKAAGGLTNGLLSESTGIWEEACPGASGESATWLRMADSSTGRFGSDVTVENSSSKGLEENETYVRKSDLKFAQIPPLPKKLKH